jgi:hypothetical protein
MSGPLASPHSVFSLRTSAFNGFLYAPIGEEENGMVLTTLSALARSGVDPWEEAERLSELPRESATNRLSLIISGMSNGRWVQSASREIASRLTALLPAKQAPVVQPQSGVRAIRPGSARMAIMVIIFLVNAVAFSALRHHETPPVVAQSAVASSSHTSPQVPLAGAK